MNTFNEDGLDNRHLNILTDSTLKRVVMKTSPLSELSFYENRYPFTNNLNLQKCYNGWHDYVELTISPPSENFWVNVLVYSPLLNVQMLLQYVFRHIGDLVTGYIPQQRDCRC